ncbi:MAG: DUF2147 domain-containing protein [Saprospiraceae bacterium]
MKWIASMLVFTFCTISVALAQSSPVGMWKTIDDKTGEAKSHVEIYEKDGKFYGKITKLLRKPADTVCEKCPGNKKNKPLIGMNVIEGLSFSKGYWRDGSILDPETGNEYGCSIWFEEGKPDELKVRGKHWTGLYRTQTWYKVK